LMDLQMPVMDGLSAIREIRRREAAEGRLRTPIYTLTANALPEHARAAAAAGADGHLTKPVNAAVLLDSIAGALSEGAALAAQAQPRFTAQI
ncbi:MAG: response regulator, partial [Caulobacteraceae bacterium]